MQRVAADLGCTKMSLYRYLPGKAELVALMVERALGAPPDCPAGLARGPEGVVRPPLQGFLAHPWSLPATVGPRPLGPTRSAGSRRRWWPWTACR